MIEAEVHQQLRAFLREKGEPYWPHHLTMARLVSRALRLGRSALIQAGSAAAYHGRYRLSYLMAVLMWPGPAVLVAPETLQQQLLTFDLPRLREWVPTYKPIHIGDRWPDEHFSGLLITTPQAWLSDRLHLQGNFPDNVPTLIDGVDDLETWVRDLLTANITASDWETLALAYPDHQDWIRDVRVQLTYGAFQHPANPYGCHLLDEAEQALLQNLYHELVDTHPQPAQAQAAMPSPWRQFWQQFSPPNHLLWVSLNRPEGQMRLHCGPTDIAARLTSIWDQQPMVFIGAAVDTATTADIYRQRLGIGDLTCLKFSLDRHNELIRLYLPEHLPLPNTPQYQGALLQEIRRLLSSQPKSTGQTVILVGDLPLKAQLAATLASEFGSRVQLERSPTTDNGILVSGWQFWHSHQATLTFPDLLIIATLPIPSLENPLVAGRVAHYKRQRQDWFRLYLLPTALMELQRSVASARIHQSIVALLDTRIHYRSYGKQFMEALSPAAYAKSLPQVFSLTADDYPPQS